MRIHMFVALALGSGSGAYADGLGNVQLSFKGGNFGGPAANVSGDEASEAEYFGLLGLEGTYYRDLTGPWAFQAHGQLVSNVREDSRALGDGDEGDRNDNYMSYLLLEGHAVNQSGPIGWGFFGGLWAGQLEDGDPEFEGNRDDAEKYYLGVEAMTERGPLDMYVQLGFTDTIGSDFSNNPSEGTDFRQIRDGIFLAVGGDYHLSDNLVFNGRIAGLMGEGSDASDEIEPLDFLGIYSEIGVEYQPQNLPITITGGVGYNLSQFPDADGEDEDRFGTVNTGYGFVGVTYWFGGTTVSENRRRILPVRPADFLVAAESSAIGNLN